MIQYFLDICGSDAYKKRTPPFPFGLRTDTGSENRKTNECRRLNSLGKKLFRYLNVASFDIKGLHDDNLKQYQQYNYITFSRDSF